MSEISEISEIPILPKTQTFSRPVCLADFFDEDTTQNAKQKYNKNYSHNDDKNIIAKNQQEFGQRKRIKP